MIGNSIYFEIAVSHTKADVFIGNYALLSIMICFR